jgi:hypothetical protein
MMALKNLSFLDFTVGAVATFWTLEAIGPAKTKQRQAALFFRSVLVYEIGDTHAFLKLNFIFGHADTSCFQVVAFYADSISMAVNKW